MQDINRGLCNQHVFFVGRGGRKEKWAYGYTKPIANFLFRSTKLFWVSHYPPPLQLSQLRRRLTT